MEVCKIYCFTFMVSLLFIWISTRKKGIIKKKCIAVAILIPACLAGLRDYTVGVDVMVYGNEWFERACNSNSFFDYLLEANSYGIGFGYASLNYIVSILSKSAHLFYFFLALLNMSLLYNFTRKYLDKIDITFVYFIFFFFYYNESLNLLRQTVAMLCVLNSAVYIEKKHIKGFLYWCLLAYSFHKTALLALTLYPLSFVVESKYGKKMMIIMYIIGSILVMYFYDFINLLIKYRLLDIDRYGLYIDTSPDAIGGRYIRFAFFGLLFLLTLFSTKYLSKRYTFIRTLHLYSFLSFVISLLMFSFSAYIARIAYYFDIFLLYYVPLIVENLHIKPLGYKKTKYVIMGAPFVLYWLIVIVIRGGGGTIPFKFMDF